MAHDRLLWIGVILCVTALPGMIFGKDPAFIRANGVLGYIGAVILLVNMIVK